MKRVIINAYEKNGLEGTFVKIVTNTDKGEALRDETTYYYDKEELYYSNYSYQSGMSVGAVVRYRKEELIQFVKENLKEFLAKNYEREKERFATRWEHKLSDSSNYWQKNIARDKVKNLEKLLVKIS